MAKSSSVSILHLTSEVLEPEKVYTRNELKSIFGIVDATINTGVFRPQGTSSVWLFVTQEKTKDRTQYQDRFDGDTLFWQGQAAGRTDPMIIGHRERDFEILVFFRKKKYEYPGAGFRYLGVFDYVSHSGELPTNFVLKRRASPTSLLSPETAEEAPFDPASIVDARERISRSITQRRGQRAFRDSLLVAYSGRCAVTGCGISSILEAAHIYPYRGPETNDVTNGLLLRTDIHTMFDCGLIAVASDDMSLVISGEIRGTEYESLDGQKLRQPTLKHLMPSKEALDMHRREMGL